jgi:hypothetical protein
MARRKSSGGRSADEPPTYLAKPFNEIAAVLDDRVAKGRELLGHFDIHVFPEPGRLEELSAQFWAWHNFNATYLERAFTTKELHDRYEGVVIAIFGAPGTDLDRLRDIAERLQRDINHLVDLRQRLSLYEPPIPPMPAAPSAGRPPINVTIQNVGQLNLAELIERVDARIEVVDRRGEASLAEGLQQVTDAIKAASDVAEREREDALDAVAVLAEVGTLPIEERSKLRGRVRGAISVIKELVVIAPSVKKAWDAWGPTIAEHLPRIGS